jgi:hypothetical protein
MTTATDQVPPRRATARASEDGLARWENEGGAIRLKSPGDLLRERAADLAGAARAFSTAAGAPDASTAAVPALGRLEEALRALSASWYQLAGDAASESHSAPHRGERIEKQSHLTAGLQDVAAALARCARACRDTGST